MIAKFVGWLNPLLSHAVVFCGCFFLLQQGKSVKTFLTISENKQFSPPELLVRDLIKEEGLVRVEVVQHPLPLKKSARHRNLNKRHLLPRKHNAS